jgi:hypothetical protein
MKTKSIAIVAALLAALAVPSFAMADRGSRGGNRGGGDRGHSSYRGYDRGHSWGHDRGRSNFTFSFGIGALFTPSRSYRSYDYCDYDYRPVYRPVYEPVYYSAPPVVYERVYAPAPVYYAPAPRYYDSCYSTPSTYYRVESHYYYRR